MIPNTVNKTAASTFDSRQCGLTWLVHFQKTEVIISRCKQSSPALTRVAHTNTKSRGSGLQIAEYSNHGEA